MDVLGRIAVWLAVAVLVLVLYALALFVIGVVLKALLEVPGTEGVLLRVLSMVGVVLIFVAWSQAYTRRRR